jgi:hypothetical protein
LPLSGSVKLITLINNTEISPAQTDSSKTPAKGAFKLNKSKVNPKLQNSKAITDLNKSLLTAAKIAGIMNKNTNNKT